MKKLTIVTVLVLVMCLLVPVSCAAPSAPMPAPAPAPDPAPRAINTIDDACEAVDAYLYNLAKTSEAKRLLAAYKDNMWSPNSCVVVQDYSQHTKLVYMESDYEGWDVRQYKVQHIFDSEFNPGSKALEQILSSEPCIYGCGPDNETTYPVTWVVDKHTGTVTPKSGNALRVEAKLME